jgi:hypothetical protein
VFCSQCGQQVPDDANFCPACGAALPKGEPGREQGTREKSSTDSTTGSIDVGAFDPQHEVRELPDLDPGTGMLVVIRGPNAGSRFLLDRERTSVGRHPESDIFLDDVTVSRRHAVLTLEDEDEHVAVEDNGSLNGTYVNGDRVDKRALVTGDEVQIGRFKLLFVGDSSLALDESP